MRGSSQYRSMGLLPRVRGGALNDEALEAVSQCARPVGVWVTRCWTRSTSWPTTAMANPRTVFKDREGRCTEALWGDPA